MRNTQALLPAPPIVHSDADDAGSDAQAIRDRIALVASAHGVEPDTPLLWQGERPERVYLLVSGRVKLTRNAHGRELIVGVRTAGSFIGATAALLGGEQAFGACTLSECRLLSLGASALLAVAQADHSFCLDLLRCELRALSRELDHSSGVACFGVRERVHRYLDRLLARAPARSGPLRIALPLRQWELAQLLAMTPEHLSRVLRELESDGLVERRRGWLIVPDPARLACAPA
jgi:CRP-like cAMP-binding protein